MSSQRQRANLTSPLAVVAFLVFCGAPVAALFADEIPDHPSKLTYPALEFEVPRAEDLRHEVAGIPVYVVEDHALPLVDINILVRSGAFLEPADKVGLAALTGALMRKGGAGDLSARDFDQRADVLAADLGSSIGDTQGNAAMNCLTSVLEECLGLFFEMMKRPRFEADRLELEKANLLESLKQRNDQAPGIADREWQWLLYGQDHFSSRVVTGDTLAAITREDLVSFHRESFRPEGMVVAVSGDVETEVILAMLERHFGDWPEGGREVPWPPPKPAFEPKPGLYVYAKDIPQGRVQIGHLGKQRDAWEDPENAALAVMNDILGGGGFSSRLVRRIRSDEGLAYSAGSFFGLGNYWPGAFGMLYQSKSETVALAAKIALEELARIRTQPVSDEELRTSKASFIDTFPGNFDSSQTIANLFAADELLGRPHSYWYSYRARIEAVDPAAIQKAAEKYLHPDRLVFLMVGDWPAIEKGDPDARASIDDLEAGATVILPERDPVSMEPKGR